MSKKYLLILPIYISLCFCCSFQTPKIYKNSTDAMMPALEPGDLAYVDQNLDTLTYGDIVVYEHREDGSYDKGIYIFRIVALPNDTLQIDNEIPIVNGKKNKIRKKKTAFLIKYDLTFDKLQEELSNGVKIDIFRTSQATTDITNDTTIYIPKNHYFVMGDFRSISYDSRYSGTIDVQQILGKVVKIKKDPELER